MRPDPERPRPTLRVGVLGLMVAVAFVAVTVAAFRAHFSLGSFAAGTFALAGVRASSIAAQARAAGDPLSRREGIVAILGSIVVSVTILWSASLIAFMVYHFPNCLQTHARRHEVDWPMFALAVAAAWYVAARGRKELWPRSAGRPRRLTIAEPPQGEEAP